MKNLCTIACIACLAIFSVNASAQQSDIPLNEPDTKKPALFDQKPDRVVVEPFQITSLLTAQVGEPIVLNLPSFRFEGNVISSVSKYENSIQSVVIRSTNYNGAIMTVTRAADENGNPFYTGRILSKNHGDLYELKRVDNGFALVKNKYNNVVME